MGNSKRADQFAGKNVECNKNYLDLIKKDSARELVKWVRAFELFPTHSASLKVFSLNTDFSKNERGLICV